MAQTVLALDTSSPVASVAFVEDNLLLGEVHVASGMTHAERLLGLVDQLLREVGRELCQVKALAVAHGPGSFTGLRVGMATAKGLALALDVPLVGMSTLTTLAYNLMHVAHPVCAMLDARKNEVYAARYLFSAGQFELQGEERVCAPESFLRGIEGEAVFVGDGALRYRSLIVAEMGKRAHFVPPVLNQSRAAVMAWLASKELEQNTPVSADLVAPVYIRPSEAEIAYRRNNASSSIEG